MFNTTGQSPLDTHVSSVHTPVTPHNGAISLAAIAASLSEMARVAQVSGLPVIEPLIIVAAGIITTIQQLRENKKAFIELAGETHTMLKTVLEVVQGRQNLSQELERDVKDFLDVLKEVEIFVEEQKKRGRLTRLFAVLDDLKKIQGCRRRLTLAFRVFELRLQMGIRDDVVFLKREAVRGNLPHPPSYTPGGVSGTDPTIPEEVSRIAQEDFDRLLPIIGVYSVFQEPPTILQISGVLNMDEGEIMDSLDSSRRAIFMGYLGDLVCRRDGSLLLDLPKYHDLVAQWCLGQKVCAKDAFYAADFWVYHVCHSSPSPQLRDALTESDIPLDPISNNDLPEIISWLEQISSDEGDWQSLITTYRQQYGD
ncbi:hypothetical protein B0H11DRAFT_2239208 [Mycena galericulata]|nr:hypothetical protein B0H11DRAFT_2239208 [Mycena galericulata]